MCRSWLSDSLSITQKIPSAVLVADGACSSIGALFSSSTVLRLVLALVSLALSSCLGLCHRRLA